MKLMATTKTKAHIPFTILAFRGGSREQNLLRNGSGSKGARSYKVQLAQDIKLKKK